VCGLVSLFQAGLPKEVLGYDALLCAVEKWGLGLRVRLLLQMEHEAYARGGYTGEQGGYSWEQGGYSGEQGTVAGAGEVEGGWFVEGDTSWFDGSEEERVDERSGRGER